MEDFVFLVVFRMLWATLLDSFQNPEFFVIKFVFCLPTFNLEHKVMVLDERFLYMHES